VDLTTEDGEPNWNYINRGQDWTWDCDLNEQSPVDIEAIKGSCDNLMIFDFSLIDEDIDTELLSQDNLLTADGIISKLYATDIDGVLTGYDANKFQIHSPSEHKIEGRIFDIELQIFHTMRDEFAND